MASQATEAAKNLAQAKREFGAAAAAGSVQAAEIIKQYEEEYEQVSASTPKRGQGIQPRYHSAKAATAVTVTPDYTKMSATALDDLIKTRHAQCKAIDAKLERNKETLYLALEEMERRFDKQQRYRTDLKPLKAPTWHGYLKSRGVQPDAFRQWKSRRNKAVAKAPVQEVNAIATGLIREFESMTRKGRLAAVVKDATRLNPTIAARLILALQNSAKEISESVEKLSATRLVFDGKQCHQRQMADRLAALHDEPHLAEKKRLAANFKNATWREIPNEQAKALILQVEYLGRWNDSTRHSVGLFFGEHLGAVECFGSVGGTHVAGCCGDEYKNQVLVLVRGASCFWTPKNTGSFLLSKALDLMAQKGYPIVAAFSDPQGSEIGQIYQSVNAIYTGMTQPSERYITPDGVEHDSRQIHALTRDRRNGGLTYKRTRKEQREILIKQGVIFHKGSAKHRYIFLSGTPLQKRKLRKALKLSSLPYPKREMKAA